MLTSQSPLDDFPLDICGQNERTNLIYTQITFCFPIAGDAESTRCQVITNLNDGLCYLAKTFPWTAGQVIRGDNGEYKIKPYFDKRHTSLVVKDLRREASVATWQEMRNQNFPFSLLDEELFAPGKTIVEPGVALPVLLIQANFIQGGLLLTVNGHHGSMDMTGQGQVMRLLAKAMRGETFRPDEIEGGNATRTDIIPVFEDPSQQSVSKSQEDPSCGDATTHVAATTNQDIPLSWAYLAFPADSLTRMKNLTMEHVPRGTFVSRDDCLSAFVWQDITRARGLRLQGTSAKTILSRNVDVRKYFNIPSTYPGFVVSSTSHTCSVDELVHQRSLGSIAAELRASLQDTEFLRHDLRSRATHLARHGHVSTNNSVVAKRPSHEVRLSSWAQEQCCDLDFGPNLGKPEAVRRPRFANGARDGLVYFLPKDRDGGIVVGVCLREDDMERLKQSGKAITCGWAKWIG